MPMYVTFANHQKVCLAWVINYTNPGRVPKDAVRRVPDIRAFGWPQVFGTQEVRPPTEEALGIEGIARRNAVNVMGINHFT